MTRPTSLARAIARPRRLADVLAVVADRFAVSPDELTGPSRVARIASARHVAAWLLRDSGYSYPEIGRALGGRDHTTAMASVRRVDEERVGSPEVRAALGWMTEVENVNVS